MASYNFRVQLTNLFNLGSNQLPASLKQSKVVPIPKIKYVTSPNDLRPISIQPIFSKLFSKCLFNQLYVYLESNSMLSQYQFGFRKMHSTTHALIALTDFAYDALDNNLICLIVSLDIRKAYDMACKEVLRHKLRWYGVDSDLIDSLLTERSQYVCISCKESTNISKTLPTNLGFPQGLCISCLLFPIIMNDLPYHVKNSLSIMFADDTGVTIAGKIEDVILVKQKLENDLCFVSEWMRLNRQELNVDKCAVMFISKKKHKSVLSDISISINNVPLRKVTSMKILGVTIDENLNFNEHTKNVSKKCFGALWSLRPLKYVLSTRHKLIVVQALVNSIYTYACPVWLIGKNNLNIIDKIIRVCARFIAGKSKYDSIIDDINEYEWLLAQNIVKVELSKLAHKMMGDSGPEYFKN